MGPRTTAARPVSNDWSGVTLTAVTPDAPGIGETVSEQDGSYRLLNLAPGVYVVTAELNGVQKLTRENVVVRAGLNVTVDLMLEVGSMSDCVNVMADTPLLEARNSYRNGPCRSRVEIRAEAVNVTNSPQFGNLVQRRSRQSLTIWRTLVRTLADMTLARISLEAAADRHAARNVTTPWYKVGATT